MRLKSLSSVLLLALTCCAGPKRTVVTIPSGSTIANEVKRLECGVQYYCKVSDYGRVYIVEQHKVTTMIQEPIRNSDLPKLLRCGEEYICTITMDVMTIVKKK